MLTEYKVVGIYCLTDDTLKFILHLEDSRRLTSDFEVLFTAIKSALYFEEHQVDELGYENPMPLIPDKLDKNRFASARGIMVKYVSSGGSLFEGCEL